MCVDVDALILNILFSKNSQSTNREQDKITNRASIKNDTYINNNCKCFYRNETFMTFETFWKKTNVQRKNISMKIDQFIWPVACNWFSFNIMLNRRRKRKKRE